MYPIQSVVCRDTTRMALAGLCMMVAAPVAAKTQIDVLVVYTENVSQWAAQQNISCQHLPENATQTNANILALSGYQHPCLTQSTLANDASKPVHNLVDIALQEANDIYANSGLADIRFNLAAAVKIEQNGQAYDERFSGANIQHNSPLAYGIAMGSGVPNQLYQLRNRLDTTDANAAILNTVHALRIRHHADLVVMLVDGSVVEPPNRNARIDGLAMGIGVNAERDGFAVLKANIAITPYFAFTHEISHLLGANHYKLSVIPGYGPTDNTLEFPTTTTGQADNWAFQNTVSPEGKPLFQMYSDIMAPVRDADGNPVITAKNAQGKKIIANAGWEASKDAQGGCVAKDAPAGEIKPITITGLPALSTTSPRFLKRLQMASYGTRDETGCLMVQSTLEDGTQETRLVTLKDVDSVSRNAQSTVRKNAINIAQFSNHLRDILDQNVAGVAIDFGPDTFIGPNYGYDEKTINPTCPFTATGYCHWNNITQPEISTLPYALTDQNGVETQARLSIVNAFHGSNRLLPAMSASLAYGRDEAAVMANSDYFMIRRDQPAAELVISGLDSAQRYVFRVFGTANATTEFLVANYTLTSSNRKGLSATQTKRLGTHNNISRFVEFRNVRPLNGEIRLRVVADASVPMTAAVGLSAITYFPEPH